MCRLAVNCPLSVRMKMYVFMSTPPVTCAPWNPVRVKKTAAKTPLFGRKPRRVYS